jgi:UDP-N-acetylglucosamine 2-epimerase
MGIPVAHVEAGLRSRLQFMPEEINRVMLDHMSQLLFAPTKAGEENLLAEGIPRKDVHRPGDVMADNIAMLRSRIDGTELPGDLEKKGYVYVTVHRAENVDDPDSLREVVEILTSVPDEHGVEVVFPVHPHTRKRLEEQGTFAALSRTAGIHLIGPASYLASLRLARDAAVVMTDSGGLHKEAFILGTPAVTLRTVTEWVETVETGWNILAGLDRVRVMAGLETFLSRTPKKVDPFRFYGGGKAASRIAAEVNKQLP